MRESQRTTRAKDVVWCDTDSHEVVDVNDKGGSMRKGKRKRMYRVEGGKVDDLILFEAGS